MLKHFSLALFLILPFFALGKYRVYELEIINHEKQSVRVVNTNLDHIQYQTYYTIDPDEVIYYRRSWMCYENGSHFKRNCFISPYTLQSRNLNPEKTQSPDSPALPSVPVKNPLQ